MTLFSKNKKKIKNSTIIAIQIQTNLGIKMPITIIPRYHNPQPFPITAEILYFKRPGYIWSEILSPTQKREIQAQTWPQYHDVVNQREFHVYVLHVSQSHVTAGLDCNFFLGVFVEKYIVMIFYLINDVCVIKKVIEKYDKKYSHENS